jgi:hypothetical protein
MKCRKYGTVDTEFSDLRAEDLTPAEIGEISNIIYKKRKR